MTVLVDTSIWIDYFRGRERPHELEALLDRNDALVCGPVVAELLAGTAEEQTDVLWLAVSSLPVAAIDDAAWREAGERAGELRRRGSVVPLLDVLIAVAAVRAGAKLWTRDRDFERVREVLPRLDLYADAA